MWRSVNVPNPLTPRATFWNWPSITSILPLWKSAAYRKCPVPTSPLARPREGAHGEAPVARPGGRLEADLGGPGKLPEGGLDGCPDPRVPAGDRPGLRREEEHRRPGVGAVAHREVGRVAGPHDRLVDVEHLT